MISATIRFWNTVNKHGPYPHKKACELYPEIKGTRCWEWTGSTASGYPVLGISGKQIRAHRYAYELEYGHSSLGNDLALHKCDNPKCVRWLHLFKGSSKDNAIDRSAKGRSVGGIANKGEANGLAVLTVAKVLLIRKLHKSGLSQRKIAKMFKVDSKTVFAIVHRITWTHIE